MIDFEMLENLVKYPDVIFMVCDVNLKIINADDDIVN
jgi:hypothetical protein